MSDLGEGVSDTPNKGGRPKKLKADEATLKQLRGLGHIQATVREGAAFFGVALSTFEGFLDEPGVREAFDDGRASGRMSLRRTQFKLAEKNAAMAIFLGKNLLGQTDKLAHVGGGAEDPAIRHAHSIDLSQASDEELAALERFLGRVADTATDPSGAGEAEG